MIDSDPLRFPLVSVLMPSFNQAEFIVESLQSILGQDYPALEVLVMDGASTDSTMAVVQELSQKDPRIRFFTQPDTGPAEALNKGLKHVRGSIIGWLNSDDLYVQGAITSAVSKLLEKPDTLMVYGQGEHVDQHGVRLSTYPSIPPNQAIIDSTLGCFICQPTVFFKQTMSQMLGGFDTQLKTAFDFEYWLRVFSRFPHRIDFVNELLARSRLHNACITLKQRRKVASESIYVVAKYAGFASVRWLHSYANEVKSGKVKLLDITPQADLLQLFREVRVHLAPSDANEFEGTYLSTSKEISL